MQSADLNKAFVAAFEIAHYQRFERVDSSQQRSCIIDLLNSLDWKQRLTWYDFSSNNLSILHYQFALSDMTYLFESQFNLWLRMFAFSFCRCAKVWFKMLFHSRRAKAIKSCWIIHNFMTDCAWDFRQFFNNRSQLYKLISYIELLIIFNFLNQSELTIFFWVLFWILLTTEIWDHYRRKESSIFKVHWTYSLFSLILSCEKFWWILFIASCLIFFFSKWCEEFINHWTWLAKSSEWRLSEDELCEMLSSDRLKVINELDIL